MIGFDKAGKVFFMRFKILNVSLGITKKYQHMKSRIITRLLVVFAALFTGFSVFASNSVKETKFTSPVYATFSNGILRADQPLHLRVVVDIPAGTEFTAVAVEGKNNNGVSTEVRTGQAKDGKVDVDIIIRGGNTNPDIEPIHHAEVVKVKIFDIVYITVDNISGVYGSQPTGPTGVTSAKIVEINYNDDPATEVVIGQSQLEISPVIRLTAQRKIDEVTLYPNPVRDGNLTVAFDEDVKVTLVTVHNAVGALVYQVRPASAGQKFNLDLGNLNSGIYFVRLETAGGEIVKKFNITK